MAPIVDHTIFDSRLVVYVRKNITASGRHYSPGDIFDWRRICVARRRVSQLFGAGYLTHHGPEGKVVDTEADDQKPAPSDAPRDDSDLEVDSLAALQEIAKAEGAEIKTSKVAQREAIVAARDARASEE